MICLGSVLYKYWIFKILDYLCNRIKVQTYSYRVSGISPKTVGKVQDLLFLVYCDVVFGTHIRDLVSLSEFPGSGGSIFDYDAKGRSSQDYAALTAELLQRTK